MRRPPKRNRRPALEGLESRRLLSGDLRDRVASIAIAPPAGAQPPSEVQADADRAAAEAKPKEPLKRFRVSIYGIVFPADFATGGKEKKGMAVVGDGVVWLLDTSAVKGLTAWSERLVRKPVVVFGAAELTREADGKVKRKIKVNWMEILKDPDVPPAFPNGRPKPKGTGPR
jgi:hypothetical protein